jgi:hypothetical protein
MDTATRTRTAFAAAVGAIIELSDGDASAATRWIGDGFPRGDGDALGQAHLLLLAVEREPGMGAEALYNTAALAYGGKMGGFEALPLARRTAFMVFRAVASALPRDLAPPPEVPDIAFKLIGIRPRDQFRRARGLESVGAVEPSAELADAVVAAAKQAGKTVRALEIAGRQPRTKR